MAGVPTLPRLPVLPDVLRRVRVPQDLDAVTSFGAKERPSRGGMSDEAVARIWSAAVELYRSGVHPAVQVCVRREGTVVLDRAIGHARGNGPHDAPQAAKELATPATPFVIYSGSKALTAFVIHMLHERGELNISHHVCHYIPEYARNGKREITIAQLLSHRAGVPALPREALDLERAEDREFRMRMLCDAKPFARPGRFLAYHAVSGGYILREIVQRVTGRELREVLAQEILDPLRFRWTNFGVAAKDVPKVALNYATGFPVAPPLSLVVSRALGVPFDEVTRTSNDPRFLTATVPSANVVTTANELSRFYEIFRRGGELRGVRVMSPEAVRDAITEQSHLELDLSLGLPHALLLRADAGRAAAQPLRPGHTARVRPSRLHEHPRLGRPAARALVRRDHQRQAPALSRAAALLPTDAAHHRGGAQGAGHRDGGLGPARRACPTARRRHAP